MELLWLSQLQHFQQATYYFARPGTKYIPVVLSAPLPGRMLAMTPLTPRGLHSGLGSTEGFQYQQKTVFSRSSLIKNLLSLHLFLCEQLELLGQSPSWPLLLTSAKLCKHADFFQCIWHHAPAAQWFFKRIGLATWTSPSHPPLGLTSCSHYTDSGGFSVLLRTTHIQSI